jgi:hypothetical protein
MVDLNMKDIILSIAVHCLFLGCVAVLTVLSVPGARAQPSESAPTPKAHADERSANEGDADQALSSRVNDPTSPLSLIQFRDVLAPSVPGADGPANLFEIQPVLPIASSHGIPFDQLIKITLPVETTPGPERTTGLGDFQFFDLVTVKQSWGRWGLGPVLVFPTATSDSLGQGKWQAGPAAAIMYTAVKHLQVGAVFQNPISFAGDSSRDSVNYLSITPTLTYNLPGGWFGGYSDFDWIFDWENDEATIPVGLQIGKVFSLGSVPFSFSLEGAYNVVRPADTPQWLVGIELNWILTGHSKTH